MYSSHLFLISSAFVRSILFLSFIKPIFAWNVPLISPIIRGRQIKSPMSYHHLIPVSKAISENLQQTCCRGCEEKRTSLHSWWGCKSVYPLGKECESEGHSVASESFRPHGLYSPWNSPGQNTRVGSLFFLQGIFPTQGLNPGLPNCRQIIYQLSHKGRPKSMKFL